MLNQVRIGRQLVVAVRQVPVFVVPAFAFALAELVVVDPVFRRAGLVAEEGVAVRAGIRQHLVRDLPADDVEPALVLAEELGAALVDDGLHVQGGKRRKLGPFADLVQRGEAGLVGVAVRQELGLGIHQQHLGVADDGVVGAGVIVAAGAGVKIVVVHQAGGVPVADAVGVDGAGLQALPS